MAHPPSPSALLMHGPSPADYFDRGGGGGPIIRAGRPPLRESTGNAQHQQQHHHRHNNHNHNHHHDNHEIGGTMGVCHPAQPPLTLAIPPSLPPRASISIPAAAILHSQSLDGLSSSSSLIRPVQTDSTGGGGGGVYRGRGVGVNPLYRWSKQFQDYRNKQAQKEPGEAQVWPDALEDAFLDALLLIPNNMGRKKYFMNHKPHGRNMLIGEYILLACGGGKGDGPESMGVPALRGIKPERKQVSSHIQVVKGFYKHIRTFHFFFPTGQETKRDRVEEESSTPSRDDDDAPSFKNNPILTALAGGRFPAIRPNYEYFERLLALDRLVTVKPKACWIFVSSSSVRQAEDGTVYGPDGVTLDPDRYPHLRNNGCRDETMSQVLGPSTLLHEYTREVDQQESASVRKLVRRWQDTFPAMAAELRLPARDEDCVLYEMDVTLALSGAAHFPPGSDLHGFVEMTIAQLGMERHRWKCVTRLARPAELCREGPGGGGQDPQLYWQEDEVGIQFIHRPGCRDGEVGKPDCACMHQPRRDLRLPFLASYWATILSHCGQYPDRPPPLTAGRSGGGGGGSSGGPLPAPAAAAADGQRQSHRLRRRPGEQAGAGAEDSDGSADAAAARDRGEADDADEDDGGDPSAGELLGRVAMTQELYSAPPNDLPSGRREWTRRAVVLWKFRTVRQRNDKGEAVAVPAKTLWRYLTVNDPASQYHQKRIYMDATGQGAGPTQPLAAAGLSLLSSSSSSSLSAAISRETVMSPSPPYANHLAATMNHNFNAAWDPSALHPQLQSQPIHPHPHHHHNPDLHDHHDHHPPHHHHNALASHHNGAINVFDSFHQHLNGLTTPPPTASIHGSYPTGFETGPADLHNHLSFMSATTACNTPIDDGLGPASATRNHHFMAAPGASTAAGGVVYDDPECDPSLPGWEESFQALEEWGGVKDGPPDHHHHDHDQQHHHSHDLHPHDLHHHDLHHHDLHHDLHHHHNHHHASADEAPGKGNGAVAPAPPQPQPLIMDSDLWSATAPHWIPAAAERETSEEGQGVESFGEEEGGQVAGAPLVPPSSATTVVADEESPLKVAGAGRKRTRSDSLDAEMTAESLGRRGRHQEEQEQERQSHRRHPYEVHAAGGGPAQEGVY